MALADELAYLTATELAARIRRRELSPVQPGRQLTTSTRPASSRRIPGTPATCRNRLAPRRCAGGLPAAVSCLTDRPPAPPAT